MQLVTKSTSTANVFLWSGRVLTILVIAFMTFDSVIKVLQLAPAVEATTKLGYPASAVMRIGIVELLCLALYIWPRTATLGAVLFTGYLGGAITTQLLAGSDSFSVVFPLIIGLMIWGGLYLRDEKVRAMIPFGR